MSRTRSTSPSAITKHAQRFQELKRSLEQLEYFCKGTVLKRMTQCGKAYCACRSDPDKRHGPYFELTYKIEGKTVNVRLSSEAAPLYKAASAQFRKLKVTLQRLEKISRTVLELKAKLAQSQ
jgi:type II secretory pathway component PulJ